MPSFEWIIQPQIRLPILSGREVCAGEHIDNARHLLGIGNVDVLDACVRMRRAHEYARGSRLARIHHRCTDHLPVMKRKSSFGAPPRRCRVALHGGLSHCSLSYSAAWRARPIAMAVAPAAIALTMLW